MQISIYYVSDGLHGILVLNKIKYPIASGGLRPQTPLFTDTILMVAFLSVNPRSIPECSKNLLTPLL